MLSQEKKAIPVPVQGERNIMITSALPYVNNYPHLGNIIGAVLSADVFSRYCKQRGYNTIYVCGTDEYGTATETKAFQEGLTPQEICSKYYKLHKEVYEWFDIEFDYFGRTSTEQQTKIAQDIFLKLHENGFLTEKTIQQLYDEESGKFLADRFVKGTCPACGYEDARGDQCDKCGKLMNSTELINPRSVISNSVPVLKETDHIFIKLDELQSKTKEWFENNKGTESWTTVARSITESWFQKGLEERCITRDLKWGTPVPLEKFKDKVFYVWFDAPIGYISITAAFFNSLGDESAWEKWWKNSDDQVKYYQFMGKDNVPFHSVIFPSSLLGTGEKWKLVDVLSSTEYLNYENLKFSKTNGTGVFGDQAKDTGIPSEVWRYYLIAMRPEQSDTRFEWTELQLKNNNELLANLGNYTNRVLKFIESTFGGNVPAAAFNEDDQKVIESLNVKVKEYIQSLENVRLKEGLQTTMFVSKIGNQYLQEQKPWELAKTNMERCATVINLSTQIVALLTTLLEPYMPGFCKKLNEQLNYNGTHRIEDQFNPNAIPADHKIGTPTGLFKKIEDKEVKEWKKRFGGGEDELFQLDLRVGEILSVELHPKADKLYVFKVKIADNVIRNIVGGLREAYPEPESLIGKRVVVACNLVVAKLKDVESEGMLLASKDDTVTSLICPSADIPLGTQIYPKGAAYKPEKVIKKGPLKTILDVMKIGKNGVPTYKAEFPLVAFDQNKKEVGKVATERDIKEGSGVF